MYAGLCTIATSNIRMHMLHMDSTNNNIIASNYNSSQVVIARRLLDKTIRSLTITVANTAAQQPDHFASGRQMVVVSNTLFAPAYYVPTLASVDCETCLENLVENKLSMGSLERECLMYGAVIELSSFGF
jgi:hypothetical protein